MLLLTELRGLEIGYLFSLWTNVGSHSFTVVESIGCLCLNVNLSIFITELIKFNILLLKKLIPQISSIRFFQQTLKMRANV